MIFRIINDQNGRYVKGNRRDRRARVIFSVRVRIRNLVGHSAMEICNTFDLELQCLDYVGFVRVIKGLLSGTRIEANESPSGHRE